MSSNSSFGTFTIVTVALTAAGIALYANEMLNLHIKQCVAAEVHKKTKDADEQITNLLSKISMLDACRIALEDKVKVANEEKDGLIKYIKNLENEISRLSYILNSYNPAPAYTAPPQPTTTAFVPTPAVSRRPKGPPRHTTTHPGKTGI